MIKALLKKEFAQLLSVYTFDSRKGKQRSKGATTALLILLGFALVSFSFMFFSIYMSLMGSIGDQGWLLFAMAGLMTLLLGVIGSVFTTYAMLYNAKDNELLLSMPIPAPAILFARMVMVCLMSLIGCMVSWAPAMFAYAFSYGPSLPALFFQLIMLVCLTAVVTVLTSILGWLVALISKRLRSKTFFTVLLSLVFIAGYYFLYFRMNSIIRTVADNIDRIAEAMKGWGYPAWMIGRAAVGEPLPALVILLVSAALFALMYFVLSKTLFAVLTASSKVKKAVYREREGKRGSVSSALLKRELKRFVSSPTLLLNTGLGIVFMVAGAIAAIVKAEAIRDLVGSVDFLITFQSALPLVAFAVIGFLAAMDCFTASTVSLEGKEIWLIQSMPVSSKLVLRVKELAHLLLNGIPAALVSVALGIVLKADVLTTIFLAAASVVLVRLTAAFGLMMNLLKPNLEWTNEAVPVKQGVPVLFTMLFGMGAIAFMLAVGIPIALFAGPAPALITDLLFAAAGLVPIELWIGRKGSGIFGQLN